MSHWWQYYIDVCDGVRLIFDLCWFSVVWSIVCTGMFQLTKYWSLTDVFLYSWAAYLRVQTTSLTFMVATMSFSPNSRMISDAGSPPCFWISLLPSNVMTLFTWRPSKVSSSNSLPNSNEISEFLNVDDVTKVNLSPSFFNSTVGETEFPILRRTNPTPATEITINELNDFKCTCLRAIRRQKEWNYWHWVGNKPLQRSFLRWNCFDKMQIQVNTWIYSNCSVPPLSSIHQMFKCIRNNGTAFNALCCVLCVCVHVSIEPFIDWNECTIIAEFDECKEHQCQDNILFINGCWYIQQSFSHLFVNSSLLLRARFFIKSATFRWNLLNYYERPNDVKWKIEFNFQWKRPKKERESRRMRFKEWTKLNYSDRSRVSAYHLNMYESILWSNKFLLSLSKAGILNAFNLHALYG